MFRRRPSKLELFISLLIFASLLAIQLYWRSQANSMQARLNENARIELLEARVYDELALESGAEVTAGNHLWSKMYGARSIVFGQGGVAISCRFGRMMPAVETPATTVRIEPLTDRNGSVWREAVVTLRYNAQLQPHYSNMSVCIPMDSSEDGMTGLILWRDWPVTELDMSTAEGRALLQPMLDLAGKIGPRAQALLDKHKDRSIAMLNRPVKSPVRAAPTSSPQTVTGTSATPMPPDIPITISEAQDIEPEAVTRQETDAEAAIHAE
jgi:hypothetical protein